MSATGVHRAASRLVHLSRRYRFSASHRLHVAALGDRGNRELFGKCNNPFGHGHNYSVQVTLAGPVGADTGMVVNLADLDVFAEREVVSRFDCSNLNSLPAFATSVPSTENLCFELWRTFEGFVRSHTAVRLVRIRVEETNNNAFDYFGQGSPIPSLPESHLAERPTERL